MENIMRKGEIACHKKYPLFSQCFLHHTVLIVHFKCTLKCRLQFVSIWTCLKFCRLVINHLVFCKGSRNGRVQNLTHFQTKYFRLYQTERVCRGRF